MQMHVNLTIFLGSYYIFVANYFQLLRLEVIWAT